MEDPNITMEEYIQLMADKARGRDQTFNWETATYGKVYCEDLDSFTDFETDFPTIVYNDASTSNQNVSSEPTISIYNAIKSDIDFHISFYDSEDEDYTFIYNKDLSSYKLIPANDLKSELYLVKDIRRIRANSSQDAFDQFTIRRISSVTIRLARTLRNPTLYAVSFKKHTSYLKTSKNSRPLPDFEEYAVSTPYMILWSKIKENTFSADMAYPKMDMAYPKSGYGVSKPAQENSGIFYSWSLRQAIPICRIVFQYAVLANFQSL
ncbi:hypothetical protein Tco_0920718 [Tanacetum coccineum]